MRTISWICRAVSFTGETAGKSRCGALPAVSGEAEGRVTQQIVRDY